MTRDRKISPIILLAVVKREFRGVLGGGQGYILKIRSG